MLHYLSKTVLAKAELVVVDLLPILIQLKLQFRLLIISAPYVRGHIPTREEEPGVIWPPAIISLSNLFLNVGILYEN